MPITLIGILKALGLITAGVIGGSIIYSVFQATPVITQTLQIFIPLLLLAVYLMIFTQIMQFIRVKK